MFYARWEAVSSPAWIVAIVIILIIGRLGSDVDSNRTPPEDSLNWRTTGVIRDSQAVEQAQLADHRASVPSISYTTRVPVQRRMKEDLV
jgi:hypothetical protein